VPLPVLPQPATETAARALNRGACAVVRASSCLSATASGNGGAFWVSPVLWTWGLHWD